MANDRFQQAIAQMKRKREEVAEEIGTFVQAEAQQRVKVKTGNLRRNITHKTESEENKSISNIGTNVEYAQALEEGTSPHSINYDKPQRLNINGVWVTVGKINHPGTKPQPYLKPAIDENVGEIQQRIREGLSV